MQVAETVAHARAFFDVLPRPLGYVPTMGALHAGHLALVRAARDECTSVAASLFVNPLQFGPNEDLAKYPRDPEGDREKLAAAGVDVLFAPDAAAMYPPGFSTFVDAGSIGARYEGAVRPEHFRGVTTVVTKLLHVVQPDVLYLGQKDAQQTAVLRRMVRDLDFPVRIAIVPTIRESDGLAMSSRNAYLSAEQRAAAPSLQKALVAIRDALADGATKTQALAIGRGALHPLAALDYLDVVDAATFEPVERPNSPAFIVGAARFGTTRLLDNLYVE
ncbi:MAG: pantoate--beta-alanine ligase [Candidatus Eremiobacteraeota bacterium]|nr:pantoate--beta-alanine ligase [Candidatus Eremiobacteraeota bacterium]